MLNYVTIEVEGNASLDKQNFGGFMSVKSKNRKFKNSSGISKHEFKLGSNAGYRNDLELYNDYDYLDKLSPEEFAWLAEFSANQASGFDVDANIVGKDNAEKMNSLEWKREAYKKKNTRARNEMYTKCFKDGDSVELLENTASLAHEEMFVEVSGNIAAYWEENKVFRPDNGGRDE